MSVVHLGQEVVSFISC